MREPIALGYLLARLTDTLADTSQIEVPIRLELLDTTRAIIHDPASLQPTLQISQIEDKIDHLGEQQLIRRSSEIFQWYHDCPDQDQALLKEVLSHIIEGQRWDLEFFHNQTEPIAATESQLLTYIYQVAGCVGEFWTKTGYAKLGQRFANYQDRDELLTNGRALGEGLQLINIIRDLHEDIPAGRHYLPENKNQTEQLNHWLHECHIRLDQGANYVSKVRQRKAAFASALPLLLAKSTATKIEASGVEQVLNKKVKISRAEVFKKLIEAALYY